MSATVSSARSRGLRTVSWLPSAVRQGAETSPPQVAGEALLLKS